VEVFAMASTIQLRVDDDLKRKSDELFNDLGTDTTTAIRMFLTQALAVNGFPFEVKRVSPNPYVSLSESEMLEKLEKSREHASKGMIKEASEVSRNIRDRYGL
jgi:DNA-damage-inducible protein J